MFERFFYWWGCFVAINPYKVILTTSMFTAVGALGLLNLRAESDGWKFWLPEGSRHSIVQRWKEAHFVEDVRGTITLFTHEENVLTRQGLLLLLDLHTKVWNVTFEGKDYSHACMKIPITNIRMANKRRRRKRRQVVVATSPGPKNDLFYQDDYIDFYGDGEMDANDKDGEKRVVDLPKEIYCDIVETLEDKCGEYSLLEIWKYDMTIISNLTDQDIINAINTVGESPVFGYKTNYTNYLGQVMHNSTGHVVGAKSIRSIWLEQFDPKDIPPSSKLLGFEVEKADPFTMGYEAEVIGQMKEWKADRDEESKGYDLFINVGRSYSDEASGPIEFDVNRTMIGYAFMFLYTMLTLGKLNLVEHKTHLAATGIMSCLCGCIIGLGLSMAFGFTYTSVSGILPFICLGIGIDDMFVIVRCFNNIKETEKEKNGLVKNIGVTMKHAGVSITITSLTDIFAFCIGALASFPALQSFCISAAIAITATYLFQCSWLVAWMVVDQRRIQQKRDGLIPIIVHRDWHPPKWSQKDFGNIAMNRLWRLFEFGPFKAVVILLTIGMLAVGIWGTYNIRVSFDIKTFLHRGSYFKKWIEQNNLDFPTDGFGVNFFTQQLPYNMDNFEKIDQMVNQLDDLTRTHEDWVHYRKSLPKSVSTPWETATGFWWPELKKYIMMQKDVKSWSDPFDNGLFPMYLSDFLNNENGSIYINNFRFNGTLSCNVDAPPITAVKIGTLKFKDLQGPSEHIPAQNAISKIMAEANLPNVTFANSPIYPAWEIEEILAGELLQNLSLALFCVMVIVFITLADIYICLSILCCVIFTMIDVLGILYIWGMTLEPFSLMATIIGIGLSVDYSVHIAHAFIASEGTKEERTKNGFVSISPAILQGGLTTFLALIFLCDSKSKTFITFFKITSMTVLFGLFHGLCFLPNMLLLFGSDKVEDGSMPAPSKDNAPVSTSAQNGIDNPEFKSEE